MERIGLRRKSTINKGINRPRALRVLVIATALLGSGFAIDAAAEEPTVQQALDAPAWALAQSYLWVKVMLQFVSIANSGATIQLPGETITKSNAQVFQSRFEKRMALYREAIGKRGYKTISGAYKGETSESCARISSSLTAAMNDQSQRGIEITQNGVEAELIVKLANGGKEFSLKSPVAVADSAVSVLDAMNSEYFFRGEIGDQVIVLKPDPQVLSSWPKWARPPSRGDLESCTITLRPTVTG